MRRLLSALRHLLPAALLLLGVLAGSALVEACGHRTQCDDQTPCPFGEQCTLQGQCIVPQCATSQQCPIETYCAADRSCTPGCQNSGDCMPGYSCDPDAQECVADACEDTNVDCGFKEYCNAATGDCYDAGGQYCRPCRVSTQDDDCGTGNLCLAGYCGRDCSGGQDCPGGFECYPWSDNAGQIVAYQCFTYCWLYEDYAPGSFAAPPKVVGPLPLDVTPEDLPPPTERGE